MKKKVKSNEKSQRKKRKRVVVCSSLRSSEFSLANENWASWHHRISNLNQAPWRFLDHTHQHCSSTSCQWRRFSGYYVYYGLYQPAPWFFPLLLSTQLAVLLLGVLVRLQLIVSQTRLGILEQTPIQIFSSSFCWIQYSHWLCQESVTNRSRSCKILWGSRSGSRYCTKGRYSGIV